MNNEMNLDKIVEESKQWTLEGDCTLLQWMNQISNNLEERVTKTSSALNEMSTKLDRTAVALSNVTNNLAALQYSKFVENRVQDDDETLANPPSVNQSEGVTDNNAPGQDIYSFLKKNLEMMNSCHEAYSISYEDSDDDDDDVPVTNVVYRSKNPYEARPLPHIYGSTLWKEKWHIGLCDSDNDFSGDENSEQFSESSSSADGSYESTAPTMSEWDSTAWGLNTQHNAIPGTADRRYVQTPSNDGDSSYQGEDYSQSKVSTPTTQGSASTIAATSQQPILDQRYYVHVPRRQENLFDDQDIFKESSRAQEVVIPVVPPVAPQTNSVPQRKLIPESYIPNEPPPDEQSNEGDNNRRIGAKKTLNLFDDDEFSSFMDQIVQKATNKNTPTNESPQQRKTQPETPKTSVAPNLFNDEIPPIQDNILPKQPKKAETPKQSNVPPSQQPPVKVMPSNLFNDSDDLFSGPSDTIQEPPKKTIAPNLFTDSDDLFAPSSSQPVARVVKKRSPSPKHDEDMFPPSPKPTTTAAATLIGKTKIKNLFDDDDDDDDDFDNIFAASKTPTSSKSFTQASKNLFEDESPPEPEAPMKAEHVKEVFPSSEGLFDDDKGSTEIEKVPTIEKQTVIDGIGSSSLQKEAPKAGSLLKKGLFDDFDDFDDEDDIFAPKTKKKDSFENLFEKENPKERLSSIQSKSLFGDEKKEGDVNVLKEVKPQQKLPSIEKNSLFDEEVANVKDFQTEEKEQVTDTPKISANLFVDEIKSMGSHQVAPIADLFTDTPPDDFDDMIPSNSEKTEKVAETLTDIPRALTEPIKISNDMEEIAEEGTKPVIASKVPVKAPKPTVNKSTKPQIIPRKLPEKTMESTPQIQPIDTNSPTVAKTFESSKVSATSKEFEKIDFEKESEHSAGDPTLKHDFKPDPKPKPKVIVTEDVKVPSTSRKNSAENLLAQQEPEKKPSPIPSYTSLFHDDLPPEDENPNPNSNEESPMHTVDEDIEVKALPPSSSSVPYNSLNLFTDVPPDDYFTISTSNVPSTAAAEIEPEPESTATIQDTQTKRIHSIFYDDFPETIEAGRAIRKPSNYMFNDEPPPDEKDNKPVVAEVQKEKPKVSKLKKMDFQINVGALLPSAKMPSFKKPPAVEKAQISEHLPAPTENEVVPAATQARDLPENILPNLNRDRAKVQVKRRPSTRTGRQERYRQSMIDEDTGAVAFLEENETDNAIRPSSMSSSMLESLATTKVEEVKVLKQQTNEEKSSFLEALNKKLESNQESRGYVKKMPDQATLFEESDNIFNKKVSSATSLKKPAMSKISSIFNDSDSEPENIFETMKSPKTTLAKTESIASSPATTAKATESLFDSDGIDENPFGTPKNFYPEKELQPKETTKSQFVKPVKPPTNPSSLFDDSDDGSDDLFKGTNTPKKPATQLLKKSESKQKSKPTKPKSSLFSSDEDGGSGDDLFGKTRIKTAAKKKIEPMKDEAPSSSLFADLSDDDSDGLFGTSAKKPVEGANKSKTKPARTERGQTIKQPAQAQPAKAIGNNPLADLLGP